MRTAQDRRRRARRAVAVVVCALAASAVAALARGEPGVTRARASVESRVIAASTARRALPRPPRPPEHDVVAGVDGAGVHVWSPLDRDGGPAPLVVFLHGMCSEPEPSCSYWSRGGRES